MPDTATSLSISESRTYSISELAREFGITPRALCIINPVRTTMLLAWVSSGGLVLKWAGMRVQGNPTGQVMSEQNIAEVIDWSVLPPHPQCSSLLQPLTVRWCWRAGLRRTAC